MAAILSPMPIAIPDDEIELRAVRAQGAGGQNVNKVSSAVHLRFDIRASKVLGEAHKERLLALADHRITADGVVVIKAQEHRTQEANRLAALQRLAELVDGTARAPRKRVATKPTLGSRRRRLEGKSQQSQRKAQRAKVVD